MSKMANEMQEEENISVSKVYETLKSGPFLKKLYWDVLSDMKEKDTFKEMRKTTEKLLNKKLESMTNLSDSESDSLQRKTIVAEICSMTYAIDTVYSKILFVKLQREFKSHIIDAIKDLRQERKISDSVWSKLQISDDLVMKEDSTKNSDPNINSVQQAPETSRRPVRIKRQKITPSQLIAKNNEIRSEIHEDLKAINSDEGKVDLSRKNLKAGNQAVSKKKVPMSVKRVPKKKQVGENQIPLKNTDQKVVAKNTEDKVAIKEEVQIVDPESDGESEKSVGGVSLASVSSVHTSDLSSFDDAISLCSDEEENGSKKKLSLKELKEMCNNGRFSDKFNGTMFQNDSGILSQNSKKIESMGDEQQLESPKDEMDNAPYSTDREAKSSTQKTLPKRIRKPNFKYSSENIVCTITKVKERKKQPTLQNEKNCSPAQLSRKRSKNDTSDSDEDMPSKSLKTVPVKDNEKKPDLRSQSKGSNSSELCKPQFPVRSLTSRKTAPVTLYST